MHFIAYFLLISHIFLVSCGSHISFTNTPDQVILEEDSTNDQDSTLPDPPFLAPTLQRTATDSQGRIYIKESTITEKSAFSVDPSMMAPLRLIMVRTTNCFLPKLETDSA